MVLPDDLRLHDDGDRCLYKKVYRVWIVRVDSGSSERFRSSPHQRFVATGTNLYSGLDDCGVFAVAFRLKCAAVHWRGTVARGIPFGERCKLFLTLTQSLDDTLKLRPSG